MSLRTPVRLVGSTLASGSSWGLGRNIPAEDKSLKYSDGVKWLPIASSELLLDSMGGLVMTASCL